jgi:hypothetical protein
VRAPPEPLGNAGRELWDKASDNSHLAILLALSIMTAYNPTAYTTHCTYLPRGAGIPDLGYPSPESSVTGGFVTGAVMGVGPMAQEVK